MAKDKSKENTLEHGFADKMFKEIAAAAEKKKLKVIMTNVDTGDQLIIDSADATIALPRAPRAAPAKAHVQQPQARFRVGQSWRGQSW